MQTAPPTAAVYPLQAPQAMPEEVSRLKHELQRRGIDLAWCPDRAAARNALLSRIPQGAIVMNGGSATLKEIGFVADLQAGHYDWLRPPVTAVDDPQERVRRRRRATTADYFVAGLNAITASGEILCVDGSGNRIAAYAYGGGKVFMVAGLNKIVPDLAAGFDRLRNRAGVEECRHLGRNTPCAATGRCDNAACRAPERQCGKILIIENEPLAGRICVLMIGEDLGY